MSSEHTPEWYVDDPIDSAHARVQIPGDATVIVQGYNTAEHAEFIVKACNSHDELVAALTDIHRDCLAASIGKAKDKVKRYERIIERIRARALAASVKAEGGA